MLVYDTVIPNASVKVDESWSKRGQKAFLAVVADLLQIDEMGADHGRVDRVVVAQLNLDPLTEGWKHFRENDLLVPNWRVTVPLNARLTLNKKKKIQNQT